MDAPTAKATRITGVARVKLRGQLKTAYEDGASIRQLAAGIQKSYGSTHSLLAEAGVDFRNRGGQPRSRG
ncbi:MULTISPECIES: helix-turn-helix domain-containing protein [Streptacidiphilus]|uniref:Helix-turn-helix domain-containing protein n=1 Tax=Streptacidiphilus cavernicola TaxID=3342716 RepID=A0ABV6UW91_9ACTN|nr:helix-turn-helix domain-containing protein [Streptacidiphilus jeojiense]